jgi:internalin A
MMATRSRLVHDLPDDCLELVFSFLTAPEHVALGATCRKLLLVMKYPGAWPVIALDMRANDALLGLLFNDWKLQPHTLSLAEGDVSDAGLTALLSCRSITSLDLSRTRVTDAGVRHIAHLPLRSLNLLCCYDVTDQALAMLAPLPLEELNLVSCRRVTDAGVAHLCGAAIRSLKLSGCAITDAGVARLQVQSCPPPCSAVRELTVYFLCPRQELRHLSSLSLSRCPISNSALGHLIGLPLRVLELVAVSITSTGLAQLRALPLKKLYLKDCT